MPVLLRKGDFHRLAARVAPREIHDEVRRKLDLLAMLFQPQTAQGSDRTSKS
jgi:hypothetical protein